MANRALPCPTVMRLLIRYEPESGAMFWRIRPTCLFNGDKYPKDREAKRWNTVWVGREALNADQGRGWLAGTIFRRRCKAHRAAWAIHYGAWPNGEIDHINRVRADNRIENLRVVTHIENCRNTSQYKGGRK